MGGGVAGDEKRGVDSIEDVGFEGEGKVGWCWRRTAFRGVSVSCTHSPVPPQKLAVWVPLCLFPCHFDTGTCVSHQMDICCTTHDVACAFD